MLTRCLTRNFASKTGSKKTVGFAGLGNMGFPMMEHLLKAGYDVTVYDINEEKLKRAEKVGAKVAPDMKELSKDKDICYTLVPRTETVRELRMGPNGIYKHAREGCLVIDSSTVSPIATREMASEGEKLGFRVADVPVSGGYTGAKAGTLTCMIGCRKNDYKEVAEFFSCMGKNLFYCGEPGAGQSAKICNNLGLAIQMISVCEALELGKQLKVDQKVLSKIMSLSTGSCWSVKDYNPVPGCGDSLPSSNDYNHGFETALMKKDVSLVKEEAKKLNLTLQFADKAYDYYDKLEKLGYGKKDIGILLHHIAEIEEMKD